MVVLLGPPGAGKGTQAGRLAKACGLVHLSTGDLFRHHLAQRTPLGLKVADYLNQGALVPDEVVVAMVQRRLAEPDARQGVVFDGFPRTVPQAEALDSWFEGRRSLPQAVLLEVAPRLLLKRLTRRRVCRAAGHIYHLDYHPPRQPGVCDLDGSELFQRDDDTPDTVAERLEVYAAETQPVVEYYAAGGRLTRVSGKGAPDEVAARLLRVVEGWG